MCPAHMLPVWRYKMEIQRVLPVEVLLRTGARSCQAPNAKPIHWTIRLGRKGEVGTCYGDVDINSVMDPRGSLSGPPAGPS